MDANNNSVVTSLIDQINGLSNTKSIQNFWNQNNDLIRSQSTALLNLLDPSAHSLKYLFLLDTCLSSAKANEVMPAVVRFINLCEATQVQLVPEKFSAVCKKFKDHVLLLGEPMRGVAPLLTALRKLQTSSEQLTALHPDFLLLCLLSKCYKIGLSVLENDIFEVDHPRDLFLYGYYGGMVCIGMKKFQKALELLHNVVTAPMPTTVSAIAVEAYKKYILVSLIHLGQFSTTLPKYTSNAAQRNLKNHSQPYIELVTSYSTGNISELKMCVQSNREKYERDNNLGLVKQVVSSMYKHNIHRLTQTYLTLSLQDIANTVNLDNSKEAEMHVLQMIEEGEIYATINQKDGMVRFLEDPEQYKTCEMIEHLDSSIQRMMMISKKLTTMNEVMSYDPAYLGKAGRERERQRFDFDDFDGIPPRYNF